MTIKVRYNLRDLVRYLLCMIVLFLPVAIIARTSFYSVTTPAAIWYKYKSFDFSILIVPVILIALFIVRKSDAIRFHLVILAIAIKDIIFFALGLNNGAIPFDISMYLALIAAWAITVLAMKRNKEPVSAPGERFFDWYFWLAFCSMLLRLALGMTTDGRYGAIGLSVGGTGFLAAIYFIYLLYVHKYNRFMPLALIVSFATLVLSGQRTNLFFCVLFCIPYVLKKMVSKSNGNRKKTMVLWGLAFFGIIVICAVIVLSEAGIKIAGMEYITRMIDAVTKLFNGNLNEEMSVEGRFQSIEAGLDILRERPFGITNVFYDLQHRMTLRNYPTFPHSGLLDCTLLWSTPIMLFCEIWLIKLMAGLAKKKSGMFWIVMYIQLIMIIWGGPFLEYPMLFIILLLLSMAKLITKREKYRLQTIIT
ncbi:MAG: hypothetical protein J5535_05290 [Firmicutes bacterium]|nr:hypothetical protein [Bacillota bacterium]